MRWPSASLKYRKNQEKGEEAWLDFDRTVARLLVCRRRGGGFAGSKGCENAQQK